MLYLSELLLGVLHTQVNYAFCESLVCLFVCLHISACEPELVVAIGVCHAWYINLDLSELLL